MKGHADEFSQMMPGLLVMFSKKSGLVLIWELPLLPIGFIMQAIGLLKSTGPKTWHNLLFLIGVFFIGTPDGAEIINLSASIFMAIAFFPHGIKMILNKEFKNET
jgi:hypothetical protein